MQDVKHVLILGGSGSLGNALCRHLTSKYPHLKLTVASRSEHKHQAMKKAFPLIKFVLVDIRDSEALLRICSRQDVVFHVAALKHVDIIEDNPIESIKTNVLGTINVANACVDTGVKYCIFSSTDKAVDPVNVYGYCKALSEKALLSLNDKQLVTKFQVFRWGNVVGSQGSAIPFFIEAIKEGSGIQVTDTQMTRFWIRLDDAVAFMVENFRNTTNAILIPPQMKAANITRVISTLEKIIGKTGKINIIGIRKGEKLHEALLSQHSRFPLDSETCSQYTDGELTELLTDVVASV